MNTVLLFLACGSAAPEPSSAEQAATQPPAELPSSILDLAEARGEMLRFNQLEGFRARRPDFEGSLAILALGDPRGKEDQLAALRLAELPALVLVVSSDTDLDVAEAYLGQLPGIDEVERRTLGEEQQ
jgi:hypothetical protein